VEIPVDTGDGTGVRDFLFDQDTGLPTQPIPPSPSESGWKDVFIAPPFMITRLTIRLAPQSVKEADLFPGKNTFPFDPTTGPGYVWHCHILDHEDNDMMRPMQIVNDDRPSLNSMLTGNSRVASRYSTPATKPGHEHKKPATKGSKPVAARSTTERTALVAD
jgi:hypothetical protein